MLNFTKVISFLLIVSILLSSCGVMFGGSRYNGSIAVREHPNAKIYVNGNHIGTGTALSSFPRNKALTVEVFQEGCEKKVLTFDNSFRGGSFVLSFLMWGLVGLVVDGATGACYKPDHKNNPNIQKLSDKNYLFTVDYSECIVK